MFQINKAWLCGALVQPPTHFNPQRGKLRLFRYYCLFCLRRSENWSMCSYQMVGRTIWRESHLILQSRVLLYFYGSWLLQYKESHESSIAGLNRLFVTKLLSSNILTWPFRPWICADALCNKGALTITCQRALVEQTESHLLATKSVCICVRALFLLSRRCHGTYT